MTTDENKITNPVGSNGNPTTSNDLNQADLMTGDDLSDINLNLEGIELPITDADEIIPPVFDDDEYRDDFVDNEIQEDVLQPLEDLELIQEISDEEELVEQSDELLEKTIEPKRDEKQLDELVLDEVPLDLNKSNEIESNTSEAELDLDVEYMRLVGLGTNNADSLDEVEEYGLDREKLEVTETQMKTDSLDDLLVGDLEIGNNVDNFDDTVEPEVNEEQLDELVLDDASPNSEGLDLKSSIMQNVNNLGDTDELKDFAELDKQEKSIEENIQEQLGELNVVENNENYDWISMENQKVEEALSQNNTENKTEDMVVEKSETKKGLNQVDDFSDLFSDTTSNVPQNIELTDAIESTENLIKDIEEQKEGFIFDTPNTHYEANDIDLDNIKNVLNTEDSGPLDLPSPVADMSNKEEEKIVAGSSSANIDEIIKSSQFEKIEIDDVSNKQLEGSVSLDSLISDVGSTTTVSENVPSTENVGFLDSLSKRKKGAGLKLFILIILLVFGGGFILKTMYPEEINDIISAIKNGNNIDIESLDDFEINNDVLDENILENEDLADEIDPDSLAGQLESEDIVSKDDLDEGPVLDDIDVGGSIDINSGHGSANDFNAFESLDDLLGGDEHIDEEVELLDTLGIYLQKGEEFQAWGRNNENQTAFKYGGFIIEYAKKFIEDIESGAGIDRLKIEEYIDKFDIYLSRLNDLRNSIQSNLINEDNAIDEPSNFSE